MLNVDITKLEPFRISTKILNMVRIFGYELFFFCEQLYMQNDPGHRFDCYSLALLSYES